MKNKIILTILILSVIAFIFSCCDGWGSVIPTIPDDVPVIEESITPNFGPPGTEVTIKGRNFGEVNYLLTNPYLYYNVTFGNSLVIGMSWSDTQIIVEAPSDYGTGIQNASMAAAILRFFVTGKITELLEGFLPELVVLELDVGSEAWWKSWYKIAAAIGLPFVGVRPKEGEMDVIVTVETPAGSAEALFTYVVPPQPPTPLSPGLSSAPGPIIYTLTPTLTWAEVDNADYYDLAIKEYPYNTNIIYNFQEIYGSSFVVPSERLEEWKKYCWNVRAHNSNGFGNYSETLYFQIENVNELLTITTITASAGPNGSISPSGDQIVNQGSDKSFTITPDTGYQIDDVLVDGSSVGAVSSYTFNNVTEDHTIFATFSKVSQPDLVITDLCIEPDPPVLGDYYNLEIRFENKGDEDILENFSINIYFDDEYIHKYDREGLDNEVYCVIKSLNFSRWPSDTNLHIIKAVIDPNNIINESNENNNQYSIQIRATEPAVRIIMEEFNGSSIGDSYGIVYTNTINGQGAVFSRVKESRIEYPFSIGFPHEGTIEYLIKVYHGYRYSDYVLNDNSGFARIFDTGSQDVWYPGAIWIDVCDNGTINLGTATAYAQPESHNLKATGTDFTFNEWHTIGISFGNQGQYIMLDGNIVAANASYTESLQTCGNFTSAVNVPTVGELVSCFWVNNRHDIGFEGVIDRFRVSEKQKDWYLSKTSSSQY